MEPTGYYYQDGSPFIQQCPQRHPPQRHPSQRQIVGCDYKGYKIYWNPSTHYYSYHNNNPVLIFKDGITFDRYNNQLDLTPTGYYYQDQDRSPLIQKCPPNYKGNIIKNTKKLVNNARKSANNSKASVKKLEKIGKTVNKLMENINSANRFVINAERQANEVERFRMRRGSTEASVAYSTTKLTSNSSLYHSKK